MRTHPIFGTSRMHSGTDFGAPTGSPVAASDSGRVVSAGWRGGYGNTVVIDHGGGMATLYAHLSSISVSAGQSVSRGQGVGAVGCTGYCTGPHLHFEVRVNGATRNPMNYL
jgi:murein DD-endopeptidase MepM/ murein hydrolase activator NlpD